MRGQGSTVNMPTFTPFQGQQIGIPDTAGLGFGFAGLQNQENIANIQGDTSKAVAGINAGASEYGANLDYQLGKKQLDLQYGGNSGINWDQDVKSKVNRMGDGDRAQNMTLANNGFVRNTEGGVQFSGGSPTFNEQGEGRYLNPTNNKADVRLNPRRPPRGMFNLG